jgi:membrane fusion protein (multidrug efflux system)
MENKIHTNKDNKRWAILGAIFSISLLSAILYYWLHSRYYESTDDAFVDGKIISVASEVSGKVKSVHITDNQSVNKGDLLVEIDPSEYLVKYQQSCAEVKAALAQRNKAEDDVKRFTLLFSKKQISEQIYKRAISDFDIAQATLEMAEKKKAAAELYLSYTKILAPSAGRITKKSVEEGNYIQAGQPLFSIVTDEIWITANFKENQLTNMRPGQKAEVEIDAYPGRKFKAHVDSIQSGTGARFSLLPAENATGNFVKVVQRVPVKIVFDEKIENGLLVPGISAVPRVKVR